jgi:hypothetical protein
MVADPQKFTPAKISRFTVYDYGGNIDFERPERIDTLSSLAALWI